MCAAAVAVPSLVMAQDFGCPCVRVGFHGGAGVGARKERRLPIPHRNMALLWGLLVLSLSCLQSPCSAVSLGRGLGGAGRQLRERPGVSGKEEGGRVEGGLGFRGSLASPRPFLNSSLL